MAYKILIVDDNASNRYTMKSVLSRLDVEIYEACDGSETLAYLLKQTCDLIILDVQLPDKSGFELAQMIKAKKSTMAIPIIFATAVFKAENYVLEGYALGAIDYILKPFNIDLLLSKVKFYKSIADERKAFVQALEDKNIALQKQNEALGKIQNLLKESVDNWALLGNNIPLYIEIYNKEGDLIFNNSYKDNQLVKNLHERFEKDLRGQIKKSFVQKEDCKALYSMVVDDMTSYLEVKSLVLKSQGQERVMVLIHDITLEKKQMEGIKYIGYHDHLTGLWNRHYFMEYVLGMKVDEALPISIMMADVNGLKLINDGFGHTAGDELIKAAGRCLRKYSPEGTIIARWGGDEFLLLLPNTDKAVAKRVSKRISQEIEHERIADKFPVSMAIGSVTCESNDFVLEAYIKEAEDKMYVNKMQNQSSYRSFIIESLKVALFEQDYETIEHTERIGKMAVLLAEHLDLSQNEKDKLILLGSLHDIGKIGISKAILNQSKDLSDLDWNIIRRHPEIGYRICIGVPELSSIADYILSHHERWDGQGYPRQLKGVEIPLLSRLISILDAFDVITHDRPYKKAQTAQWALEEIKRCAGSQFDPNLVHVFEHVYIEMQAAGEVFQM